MLVPAEEVGQVAARGFAEAGDEGLDRGRLAIVALEVEITALPERLRAQDGLEHADDLRALLVDRRGVEVVDLQIAGRPHGVGQGTGVLGELASAQGSNVLDPLHGRATHVAAEALIAEDREAFLQAQLEPVAAGDAVAGPVVEVLVGHHRFDALIVQVGGGLGIGQQQGAVEDVQPLVLHGPEVEVAHGHDHEEVEVVLATEGVLVPLHRPLEAVGGVFGSGGLARVDEDTDGDLAAAHGDELVGQHVQMAGHQGEQVAGLGERVLPLGEEPAVLEGAGVEQIAVAQKVCELALGLDPHAEAAQHVGAVGEVGDGAEAFGLALGAEAAARHVQAHQGLVGRRIDLDFGGQHELVGQVRDRQVLGVDRILIGAQRLAVDGDRDQLQPLAVQDQRLAFRPDTSHRKLRLHPRL